MYATAESKAKFVMLFCQVVKDRRVGRSLAAEKRAEFEAQGWLAASAANRIEVVQATPLHVKNQYGRRLQLSRFSSRRKSSIDVNGLPCRAMSSGTRLVTTSREVDVAYSHHPTLRRPGRGG